MLIEECGRLIHQQVNLAVGSANGIDLVTDGPHVLRGPAQQRVETVQPSVFFERERHVHIPLPAVLRDLPFEPAVFELD